jgi:hypothetical protein
MKTIIIWLAILPVIPLFGATDSTATDATAKSAAQSTSTAKAADPASKARLPLVIPKTATPNSNGTFNYTDEQGKQWVYSNTPFGVVRVPGSVTSQNEATRRPELTRSFDLGDSVRFERPTPLGPVKWEKKKTDLTDVERHLFESQHPSSQSAATASNPESHD